ncbi:DUF4236 domain-containing protein [Moritella sp. Urea-trap-13]|uniref:DUF4236 domain-containing protein n=1 Tax=Moritella sp. Urea-trap-13 TaxID=2058327 RepID=UPI000C32D10A|nr:DUF4236 domain-containing protein [Moritella sp. Urea-trap-13]PKH06691.1 DUF4236 domain-containing protein [Moritella sp. Urea-trap-13]
MGFKFRKRIKIAPGININLSKSGVSTSIGKPGATINIGKKGVKATVGIPGSGLSYSQNLSEGGSQPSTPKQGSSLLTKILIGLSVIFMLSVLSNSDKNNIKFDNKTVIAKSLRVRSAPSADSNIVNQLIRGDSVTVEKSQNGWSLIDDGKVKGWVASRYLADETL